MKEGSAIAVSEQLYRKVMQGKRVRYVPHTEDEPITCIELTDEQAVTAAGALGVTLLGLFERFIPPHKRIARKIKAVENSILDLFAGNGHRIDTETSQWLCECWDRAMRIGAGIQHNAEQK